MQTGEGNAPRRNDPNSNYAMYGADREAKRKAQPSLPVVTGTGEGKAPRGISKEQAIALGNGTLRDEIHCEVVRTCKRTVGPRGGVDVQIVRVRPSGKCQTWKTRPNEFRLPVKYGLYESSAITQNNADLFHLASDCKALRSLIT